MALSLLFFARNVVGDLGNRVVGDDGADKTLYIWSLKWWPWALNRGENPLAVDVAWVPEGFDFGLGTAGGGLALAATPLTAAVGPVATYNILILLAPALAATSAFLLARCLTHQFGPSFVAGFIFGFSSYELGHILGHLPLSFIALVPLVPYLILRRHDREISRRRFVFLIAVVLAAEFLIVPQIFFTLVIVGIVAAAAAAITLGLVKIRGVLIEVGVGLLVASLLVAPIVAYAAVSDAAAPARSAFSESADVLGYLVPTRRTLIRPPGADEVTARFTGTNAENGAYLGLPFLVLIALASFRRPASRPRLLLALTLVGVVMLSLGTRVKIAGEVVGIGPWAALAPLPVVGSALPIRLTLYTSLLGALLVALALADRGSVTRWLLAAAGVVAILPNLQLGYWSSDVPRPQFFATERYLQHVPENATALVLPYGPAGWSMLWQAESGFAFRLIGGHFGLRVTPAEEPWRDVYENLGTGRVSPARLRSFLAAHEVDVVIVAPGTRGRAHRAVAAAVRAPPVHVLDVVVYSVDSTRANP